MTAQHTELEARPTERTRDLPVRAPATDIYETDREIVVIADLPGVDPKTLDVTLENSVLAFSGRSEPREPEGDLLSRETGPAEYRRSFTLSEDVDRTKITAKLRNGQLRIVLAKAEQALPRKIAVTAEE